MPGYFKRAARLGRFLREILLSLSPGIFILGLPKTMKTILATFIASLTLSMLCLGQSRYTGEVGNTPVKAALTFANDRVTGSYTSDTSGKTYQLAGENNIPGVANLIEFTYDRKSGKWVPSAEVNLRKSTKNGIITWSGVMRNYDGRNVAVRFTKIR
jgi:hypothetical protein